MLNLNEIKELMAMGFTHEQIVEMCKETPEVANAKTTDTPPVNDHAIKQDINLVWGENTVTLKAVNSSKVHKDLWHVNFELLKSEYSAKYSSSKGIYWNKKDSESFLKAKINFKPVTRLDVEAQIELEHKRIEECNTKIDNLKQLIKESESKLDKLKNL